MKKRIVFGALIIILIAIIYFYSDSVFLSPSLEIFQDPFEFSFSKEVEGGDECPVCPRIVVITINGVNSDVNSDFHRWVWQNLPPGIGGYRVDPFNNPFEACWTDIHGTVELVQEEIDRIKENDPCVKIVVVGHSLGGTLTWFLDNVDCKVIIDPPVDCHGDLGKLFCATQQGICDSVDEGIKDDPGYIPLDNHYPFSDESRYAEELDKIRKGIDACLGKLWCDYGDSRPEFNTEV